MKEGNWARAKRAKTQEAKAKLETQEKE